MQWFRDINRRTNCHDIIMSYDIGACPTARAATDIIPSTSREIGSAAAKHSSLPASKARWNETRLSPSNTDVHQAFPAHWQR
jgi:hypothetical protein